MGTWRYRGGIQLWLSPEKSRPLRVSGNTAFHYKTDISTYEHYITSYINTVLQIVYAPWKLQGVFLSFSVFQCYWLTSSLWQAENKFSVKSFLKTRGTGVTQLIRFLLHFQITIYTIWFITCIDVSLLFNKSREEITSSSVDSFVCNPLFRSFYPTVKSIKKIINI